MGQSRHQFIYGYNGKERELFITKSLIPGNIFSMQFNVAKINSLFLG